MLGALKLDYLQPIQPLLFRNFSIIFTFIVLGGPILLPQRTDNNGKREFSQFQNLVRLCQSKLEVTNPHAIAERDVYLMESDSEIGLSHSEKREQDFSQLTVDRASALFPYPEFSQPVRSRYSHIFIPIFDANVNKEIYVSADHYGTKIT